MPRRYRPSKRKVEPDIKYSSEHVEMCINRVMQWGKKSVARSIVYDAMDIIEERSKRNPLQTFEQALKNATPLIEVKPRRVGGATYQVPVEVDPHRRRSLGIRWLLDAARSRPGKGFSDRLAAELMDAAQNTGSAVRKREDTHRMAEANKAFAHYRW
jgi:small subunit ribosomal protein S7